MSLDHKIESEINQNETKTLFLAMFQAGKEVKITKTVKARFGLRVGFRIKTRNLFETPKMRKKTEIKSQNRFCPHPEWHF